MITKNFVQIYISDDCEARNWDWKDTDFAYEAEVKRLAEKWNGWFKAVRVVKKIFNPETFELTTKEIKRAKRSYNHEKKQIVIEECSEKELDVYTEKL